MMVPCHRRLGRPESDVLYLNDATSASETSHVPNDGDMLAGAWKWNFDESLISRWVDAKEAYELQWGSAVLRDVDIKRPAILRTYDVRAAHFSGCDGQRRRSRDERL